MKESYFIDVRGVNPRQLSYNYIYIHKGIAEELSMNRYTSWMKLDFSIEVEHILKHFSLQKESNLKDMLRSPDGSSVLMAGQILHEKRSSKVFDALIQGDPCILRSY